MRPYLLIFFLIPSCFPQTDAPLLEQARDLVERKCILCHGASAASGLDLRNRASILKGGTRGPAAVPGNAVGSLLIQAASQTGSLKMPPGQPPLSAAELDILKRWIDDGLAAWSGHNTTKHSTHWAFQPVRKLNPPTDASGQTANPIDRFIASKRQTQGLQPVHPAGKETLLRRTYFDLIGLSPTGAQIRAFLADNSPEAYSRVVEELLASPYYGERWGRHWMDLVRYADTAGDNADYPIPEARLYRDYIIDSFNADKPYNQFLQEQIAGDVLARGGPREKFTEQVVATGFLALSRRYGTAPEELWHLTLEDSIDTVGRVVMGLTMRCARCHDHKFDPLTTKNYYSLYGYFASSRYPFAGAEEFQSKGTPRLGFVPLRHPDEIKPVLTDHQRKVEGLRAEIDRINKLVPEHTELVRLDTEIRSKIRRVEELNRLGQPTAAKEAEQADLEKRRDALIATIAARGEDFGAMARRLIPLRLETRSLEISGLPPGVSGAYAVSEGDPKDVTIQIRGNPEEPGPVAKRGLPEFLSSDHPMSIPEGASGRLQLAEWLTDPAHPLTARVMVNRIWQYHFGQGLVATPSNFGLRGEAPSHPELLDWLAAYFVERNWSMKAMHRLIVSSNTYRLASTTEAVSYEKDPTNRYYWRFSRRRLDAEEIRDAMLFAGGNLDLSRPGPHPFPPIEKWNYTQHFPFRAVYDSNHRTVYLMTQRLHRHPFLALFDGPDTNTSTDVRTRATVPLQALYLMNNPFVKEQAELLARRTAPAADSARRIRAMVELAWGRIADDTEVARASSYLDRYRSELRRLGQENTEWSEAWSSYARVLLTANEFLYVD